MPQQIHANRTRTTKPVPAPETQTTEAPAAAVEHVSVDDIDELLDEIDAVLEENANEVVQAYRQRGGQ